LQSARRGYEAFEEQSTIVGITPKNNRNHHSSKTYFSNIL